MPSFETIRRVPFSPQQMLALVADVENYPKFFPLCEKLRVSSRSRDGERTVLLADMTVGYKGFHETITSRVVVDPVQMTVSADLVRGPFRHFENRWSFTPAPGGCDVRFAIDYAFNSVVLQLVVGAVFDRAFRRCTEAFEERARQVYGQPAGSALPG